MGMKLSAAQNLGTGVGGGVGLLLRALKKKSEDEEKARKIGMLKQSFMSDPHLQGDQAFQALDLLGEDIDPKEYFSTAQQIRSGAQSRAQEEQQRKLLESIRTENKYQDVTNPDGSVIRKGFDYLGRPLPDSEEYPISGPVPTDYGSGTLATILEKDPSLSIEKAINLLRQANEAQSTSSGMTDAQKRAIMGQITSAEAALADEYAKLAKVQRELDAKEVDEGVYDPSSGQRVYGGQPNHKTNDKGEIIEADQTPKTTPDQEYRRSTARAVKEDHRREIMRIKQRIEQLKGYLGGGGVPAQDDITVEQVGQ